MDTLHLIITGVFAGTNIWQFIHWKIQEDKMKAEVDKLRAEADEEKFKAKHKGLDLMQDQADNLIDKLNAVQSDYVALQKQMRDEMTNHLTAINTKCNEIAQLKSQVIYFKGLRCYKSDCSCRISQNPKDNENKE